MKLNIKRTTFIGFAFFTILMLWQVYNTYCPLFLTDLLVGQYGGKPENYSYVVGFIMALDNVLALFMLPLFGYWSDKTVSKLGKRIPYIILGTFLSVVLFPLIAVAFIEKQLVWLAIIMGLILISMNIYRSPAVALMPDITPKPLRSRANAIVNLIGYIGAIFAGALALVFQVKKDDLGRLIVTDTFNILAPFIITSILMIVALVILVLKIRENKLAEELKAEMELGEKMAETNEVIKEDKPLSKQDKRNLFILLGAIFLWFFGFNAIETFGSLFGVQYLAQSSGWWGTAVIIMTISSIIAFIPAGMIATKIGRKNSILLGLLLMLLGTIVAIFLGAKAVYIYYPCIAIAGIGWAWVNVNSYPMVVELANKKNIGRFTGWYYSASMLAQSITPICVGLLFNAVGYGYLFIYATVFIALSFVVISLYSNKKNSSTIVISDAVEDSENSTNDSTTTKNHKANTKPVASTTNSNTKKEKSEPVKNTSSNTNKPNTNKPTNTNNKAPKKPITK